MSVIPARAPPVEGESLLSVIRRTTQAMGYETTSHLLKLTGQAGVVPFWLNELQAGSVSERLADLLGRSTSDVMRHTIHRYSQSLVLTDGERPAPLACDNRTRLRYFDPQTRVCPQCLGDSSNPFEKLIWSFRPAPVCVEYVSTMERCCSPVAQPAVSRFPTRGHAMLNADVGTVWINSALSNLTTSSSGRSECSSLLWTPASE